MNDAMIKVTMACVLGAWVLAMPVCSSAQNDDLLAEPEQEAMTDTLQHALEYNQTNESSDWVNPDTGRAGGVTPIRTFEDAQGQPCREFLTTIIIGGREEQGYGTACRQPDGDWQIVSDDVQEPPPQMSPQTPRLAREVREIPPATEYYGYPGELYGPYRIFLSFSFIERSGHRHTGHRYLGGYEFRHRHPFRIRERVFVGPRVFEHYPWRGHRGHRDWEDHRGGGNDRHRGGRDDHYDDGGRRGRGGDDRGDRDDHRGGGRRGRGSDDR